jgi:hypothetical protein
LTRKFIDKIALAKVICQKIDQTISEGILVGKQNWQVLVRIGKEIWGIDENDTSKPKD